MRSSLATAAVQLVCTASVVILLLVVVQCQAEYPRLEHKGKDFANNSFIPRQRLNEDALQCVTCDHCNTSGINWYMYDEQGQEVLLLEYRNSNDSYYTTFEEGGIGLRHTENGSVGIFRCDILNSNGVKESLYIYIGTERIGKNIMYIHVTV